MKSQAENAAEQAAFWNGPGGKMWLAAYDRIQHRITHFSEAALAAAPQLNGKPRWRRLAGVVTHVFTHFPLELTVFTATVPAKKSWAARFAAATPRR